MANQRRLVLDNLPIFISEIASFSMVTTSRRSIEKAPATGDLAYIWNGEDIEGSVVFSSGRHFRRFQTFVLLVAAPHSIGIALRVEALADQVLSKIKNHMKDFYELTPKVVLDDIRVSDPGTDRERDLGRATLTMEYH